MPKVAPDRVARLRGFAGAQRGNTIIEFAMVAAPFIGLIVAILNIAIFFFANALLQTAAETTARLIMTGQAQTGAMTQAQVKQQACATLPGFMPCNLVMMDVRKASTFSDVDTASPTITFDSNGNVTNSWSYDTGGAGAIVLVRLMYVWQFPVGPFGADFGNLGQGRRLLVATTVSKTEAY